jgi:1,2-diacylglycerol 3-beta-galactosyltransferase
LSKRILFLMSDTGGGHRAAAEAIRDALYIKYGRENIEAELIDVFRLSNFPMNYMPEFYPWIISHSKESWGMGYNLSNTRRFASALSRTMYMANAQRFKKLAQTHPVDVIVCVHSVIARPTLWAWQTLQERPPFITVVTDLVTTHMFWYDQHADMTLVPTQAAFDRGLQGGISAEKMRLTGLPVNPGFMQKLVGKEKAREELGWNQEKITILMVAGGDGMGPLYETARAINDKKLDCQLVVVAGRNKTLKAKLESAEWNQPTHIYPFVTNMPQLMDAADIIVTKAGPATITEAGIAGLPMVLMDAIPGQEDGNVTHVIDNEAGAWAPEPQQAADVVASWVREGREGVKRRSENAHKVGRPEAVWEIAEEVMRWSEHGMIRNPERSLWKRTRNLVSLNVKS